MALQTVLTDYTNYSLWVSGEYTGIRDFSVTPTNYAGFASAILKINTIASVKSIGMEWKPAGTGLYLRRLPVFIDLEAGRSDGSNDGELPSYALFQNQPMARLAEGNVHYLYFVHPETPAAVPLIRDEANHHNKLGTDGRFFVK